MNRSSTRIAGLAAGAAAVGLLLTGCGAGQIAQTATQESAVNGSSATVKYIGLRNVHLQAVQESDFLEPGSTVPLMFVVANDSVDTPDTLTAVTSDVGTVKLTGESAVPAGKALVVGVPDGQAEFTAMSGATPTTAEVTLSKPITNGLTYDFTFEFENVGPVSVAVPISAGEAPRRE